MNQPSGAPAAADRPIAMVAALLIVASNVLPIVGILMFGWDVFLVLVLYWFETAVIAFWTVLRIAATPKEEIAAFAGKQQTWRPVPLALFFTAHSGIFMGVHFMFLWSLFSGNWPRRVDSVSDFFAVVVWDTGLWVALALMFVAYGLGFAREVTGIDPLRRLVKVVSGRGSVTAEPEPRKTLGGVLARLYGRIVLMQIAIILGGMLALALGSMAPLIILIVLKTVVELALNAGRDLLPHFGPERT